VGDYKLILFLSDEVRMYEININHQQKIESVKLLETRKLTMGDESFEELSYVKELKSQEEEQDTNDLSLAI
tara:strand:- start:2417 stop:2629 length:213 start_codon:yes stop_codon:yes gene_type:complete